MQLYTNISTVIHMHLHQLNVRHLMPCNITLIFRSSWQNNIIIHYQQVHSVFQGSDAFWMSYEMTVYQQGSPFAPALNTVYYESIMCI